MSVKEDVLNKLAKEKGWSSWKIMIPNVFAENDELIVERAVEIALEDKKENVSLEWMEKEIRNKLNSVKDTSRFELGERSACRYFLQLLKARIKECD